jgi:hypothetical protein
MPLIERRTRLQWLAVAAALTAWLPLEVMSLARAHALQAAGSGLLHEQIAMMVRSVVCIPLFILAEGLTMPRLWLIVHNFIAADLIGDRDRFDAAVRRARRAMDARGAKIAAILLAYLSSGAIGWYASGGLLPPWHRPYGSVPVFSPAGWWHVLVSLPLLLALAFHWVWRIIVWDMLLWRIAHSRLQLVASHPDSSGGVGFLGESVRAFTLVAMAFSAMAAGRSAQLVSRGAALSLPEIYFNASFLLAIAVLFVGPLYVFTPRLILVGRQGMLRYGTLAHRAGAAFEKRWLPPDGRAVDGASFEMGDPSMLIDLYSVVAIARSMKHLPASRRYLTSFALWLAVPFVPVILMIVPLHTLVVQLKGLLL